MASEDKYYIIDGTLFHADQVDELSHAGVKGMQWGKHLPGTDWWKNKASNFKTAIGKSKLVRDFRTGVKTYENEQRRANTVGAATVNDPRNILGNGKTYYFSGSRNGKPYNPIFGAGDAQTRDRFLETFKKPNTVGYKAKMYATVAGRLAKNRLKKAGNAIKSGTSKLWNSGKGYTKDQINKFQSSAKKAYSKVRNAIIDYFNKSGAKPTGSKKMTSNTPLSEAMNKQRRDAVAVYQKAMEDGGIMNTINLAIQTSQFNISKGVNQFLKQIGMDDEVNAFLKKFGAKK